MPTQLTAADARQSLLDHVAAKGAEIFVRCGGNLGWAELEQLLQDRAVVRYPCEVVFDAAGLQDGEFAHPEQKGANPEDGFTMYVHPAFAADRSEAVPLVLYQLVVVNYGAFASADEAESFGAAALGLTRDEYYARLCELADRIAEASVGIPADRCGCGGGGEGCCG